MSKIYNSLGFMSGTSMDGVDASIIQSDGENKYKVIFDKYFEYPETIYKSLTKIRDKIVNKQDLTRFKDNLNLLEKKITLFHAKIIKDILKSTEIDINFVGFHGQTIFHNAKKRISRQLGDGKLLSKLTKKTVIYNFRFNDIKNGGQGAPLTPIFHKMLAKKFKINLAVFLNLGGIANQTNINNDFTFNASDIGPGMCLIDQWMRLNSKNKYDRNGAIAKSGKINKVILNKILSKKKLNVIKLGKKKFFKFKKPISYDVKNFNINFVKNLSLKDGAATITEYTAHRLIPSLIIFNSFKRKIILCGGGRKNKFLISRIKKNDVSIKFIDDYGINGDFVESQAFAYLAIRSYLKLPITFPSTTGVKNPCTGGVIINY